MNKADKPLSSRIIEIVLTVITIIVIFITVAITADLVDSYKYQAVSAYGESTYSYALEEGSYARIANYVSEAEQKENPPGSIVRYFGLGRYFYARTMTDMTAYMGDPALTDYWEQKCTEAEGACGDLSEYVVLIDEQLQRQIHRRTE